MKAVLPLSTMKHELFHGVFPQSRARIAEGYAKPKLENDFSLVVSDMLHLPGCILFPTEFQRNFCTVVECVETCWNMLKHVETINQALIYKQVQAKMNAIQTRSQNQLRKKDRTSHQWRLAAVRGHSDVQCQPTLAENVDRNSWMLLYGTRHDKDIRPMIIIRIIINYKHMGGKKRHIFRWFEDLVSTRVSFDPFPFF